ncbi:MAG TPA: UvrD-helicase domain-containing protein [Ilumatobacteraceae bacterium]|jgi:ATP-dependent exoDNAse (exonuclease V) beta subunit
MSEIVLPAWVDADPFRSMAVSAGAGSGKTTSLVARVAALVAMPGVEPAQLVVITFTEKAAREVSHRLRRSLGGTVALDDAFIGTIHAFCQSILRRYPIEAGLPPKFTTADELTSGAMADERAEQAVQTLYDVASKKPAIEEALMVVASFGAMSFLPDLVKAIDNDWLQFSTAPPQRPMSIGVAHALVMRMLDRVEHDPRYSAAKPHMRAKVDEAVDAAKTALEFVDSIHALATAAVAMNERYHGSSAAWLPFTEVMRFASFEPALSQLMSALAPIVTGAAAQRIARGELSFDDLLVLTRRLLQTDRRVRDDVRARHRYLFVDEFQDTDQVQFDVLAQLTSTDGGGPPSSLFAVGDPKQSIYGFRNADVELFSSLLAADDDSEDLTVNRRTRADVCAWINAVLAKRFTQVDDPAQPDSQVAYVPLEPERPANGPVDGPGVVVLGMPDGAKVEYETAEDTARAEAADIAALVQGVVGGGDPWNVTDEDGDRPASYRDITVLIRSRTRLGVLEHTLRQAGVPYRVEGGTLIYGAREVYELLRVLRAVDDPTNQLKVVTALRTSVFGIDDRELMEYRLGPATSPARFPKDFRVFTADAGVVGDALRTIEQFGRRKHERTPAELIAELYDSWRGVAAALYEGEQVARETWRRVRYVIDEARAWSDATGGTLAEYLAWVDRRIDDVDRVELSTDEGEDSLRIMTVHAAKGLEFPITVVAGLGGADAPNASTGLRWHEGAPSVRLGKMTSARLNDIAAVERQRARTEEARLLYVAFTRAKDHLVVSMHHKAAGCAAGRLLAAVSSPEAMSRAECIDVAQPVPHPPSHERPAMPDRGEPSDEPDEFDRTSGQVRRIWTPSGLAKALGDAAGPTSDVTLVQGSLFVDVEEIAEDDSVAPGERFGAAVGRRQADTDDREATDPGNRKEPQANDRPSRRGGRFGTAKGSAVHAVMQQVALDDPTRGLGTLVDVASEAEGVLDRRRDIELMVNSLLRGDLFRRMQESANCRREMYVGAQFGEVTVWGYVDAVFVNPDDTLTLVDFKTDTLITSSLELAVRYRPQMSAYVAALEQATGMRVSEAWLAVAQPDGAAAVEIAVDVLEASVLLASLRGPDVVSQTSRQLT